jgi:hypothetical protein
MRAVLDATTFAVLEVEATGLVEPGAAEVTRPVELGTEATGPVEPGDRSLAPAAVLAALLAGISGSVPYLPTAGEPAGGATGSGTRVAEPVLPAR